MWHYSAGYDLTELQRGGLPPNEGKAGENRGRDIKEKIAAPEKHIHSEINPRIKPSVENHVRRGWFIPTDPCVTLIWYRAQINASRPCLSHGLVGTSLLCNAGVQTEC